MQINANGSMHLLEAFCLFFRDQLGKKGFREGPRVGGMESARYSSFLKDDWIVTLELSEGEGMNDSTLHLESETDVPGIDEIWDDALIALGRDIMSQVLRMARDSKKVEQAF